MSDWTVTKPNTNKEGVAEGRSRGERGAVCPSVFRCDCCSCIDRQNRFPPAPRARDLGFVLTSFLFFFFFPGWRKYGITSTKKLTLRIYIFLFLLSIVCLLMMYGFVSLLSTYYAAGRGRGREGGEVFWRRVACFHIFLALRFVLWVLFHFSFTVVKM